MGVTGLLRLLQPYSTPRDAAHFRGQTLGVDGYSWLHRAAASCADELLRGVPSTRLVQSIDNRVRCYEHYGVQLYFVFDGASLAMKERVESQRRRARQAARAQSEASASSSASSSSSLSLRGVDITASHAAMVIAYLKARGIKFVVAPYEADAQLVWLEREGIINGIISEDSDLLVFGAQNLLTKCDAKSGSCVHISSSEIPRPLNDLASLRALAIVSGCDYSPGVAGLGPVKTNALITKFGGSLDAIVQHLVSGGRVEPGFVELARHADLAFQYQRVWNPRKNCLTYLTEPDDEVSAVLTDAIVGQALRRAEAHRLAAGLVDPQNLGSELVVDPIISRYVQRMRPVQLPKQSVFSSPLGVSRAANRRLYSSPTASPSPSPSATPSVSKFFAKKTPAEPRTPVSTPPTKPTPLTNPTPSHKALTEPGSVRVRIDPEANKENILPFRAMGTPASTRANTQAGTQASVKATAVFPSPRSSAPLTPTSLAKRPIERPIEQNLKPAKSDTIVDSPLGVKNARYASKLDDTTVVATPTNARLASIRQFAFRP